MPQVSVIIPTYNRVHYLVQAVRSVLEQTFTDLEVIVVDDGSTDDTAQTMKEWQDSRLRYIQQENSGRSAARNYGIKVAQGTYIAFLDDDDLFLPYKIAHQVDFLTNNPQTDLVAGGAELLNSAGVTRAVWRTWEIQSQLTLIDCLYNCPLIPSTILARRQIFSRLDYWFDAEVEPAEDKDLFIRLLYAGCQIDWLREVVSVYRVHENNSQGDGVLYSNSYQKLLNKLFARPDVPKNLMAEKNKLYAHFYITGALRCYANKQIMVAQSNLVEAMNLDKNLREGEIPAIIERIANFANSFYVAEPISFIAFVFNHLPETQSFLHKYRSKAYSYFYMQHVFEAANAGKASSLRDFVLALWYSPHWLRNLGVISLFIKSIFYTKVINPAYQNRG